MKKTICFIAAIAAIGFLLFYVKNWTPVMGIAGRSMEPTLKVGDLITIKNISAEEVEKGDIIVFQIPTMVREYYNYPLFVSHRVTEVIQRKDGIVFKTRGDNTGEDPFIVRAVDLRGKIAKRIPYAGLLLLFLQSKQGLLTIISLISLYGLAVYSQELSLFRHKLHKEIFSPVVEEQKKTTQAMDSFASAMAEYAEHLQSHTEVMQNLAKTTESLKDVVEKLDGKLK